MREITAWRHEIVENGEHTGSIERCGVRPERERERDNSKCVREEKKTMDTLPDHSLRVIDMYTTIHT